MAADPALPPLTCQAASSNLPCLLAHIAGLLAQPLRMVHEVGALAHGLVVRFQGLASAQPKP